jgi:prepilin-type processing-associated H-X9-DG protein/prepilin-type N-terminal cleavage/methylation domain-containing protein
MRQRRSAFTLVELLVVIGIIAVLMSLLLPALGRANDGAKTIKCAANLSGMTKAAEMYKNQYRIYVPGRLETLQGTGQYGLGDGGDQYRPRWYELLGAQVGQFASKNPKPFEDDSWTISNEWFLCPAVPEWINSRNYPYGYNHQFLGDARKRVTPMPNGDRPMINYPVPSTKITNVSETVMIADSMGTASAVPTKQRQGYYVDGKKDPEAVGNKGYLIDPPRLTATSSRSDLQIDPFYHAAPAPRHNKKANVAYCDGHVELRSLEELGYAVNPDGSVLLSGTVGPNTANNRSFSGTGRDDDAPIAK